MRIAFLSDIHGNLEAFEAVLRDIDEQVVDMRFCLGDSVGYGADPDQVLKRLFSEAIPSIMGNHDAAIFDESVLAWFNPQAMDAILKTRRLLAEGTVDRLRYLPKVQSVHGAYCVHGFPPDSLHMYLFEANRGDVARELTRLKEKICLVGHTHTLGIVTWDGKTVESAPLLPGIILLDDKSYLINIGSVGQPRDGNNNAKYVIWDNEVNSLETRFVPYDIARAANKILEAGMPEFCARRLW